jgi:hypothetical protein
MAVLRKEYVLDPEKHLKAKSFRYLNFLFIY